MSAINIRFARNEYSPDLTFIEIENDNGKSIRIGQLISFSDEVVIRITEEDMEELE